MRTYVVRMKILGNTILKNLQRRVATMCNTPLTMGNALMAMGNTLLTMGNNPLAM